jgi:hypothetical protein
LLTLRSLLFDAADVASAVDDDDEAVDADDTGIKTSPPSSSLAANADDDDDDDNDADADDDDDSIMTYSPSLFIDMMTTKDFAYANTMNMKNNFFACGRQAIEVLE